MSEGVEIDAYLNVIESELKDPVDGATSDGEVQRHVGGSRATWSTWVNERLKERFNNNGVRVLRNKAHMEVLLDERSADSSSLLSSRLSIGRAAVVQHSEHVCRVDCRNTGMSDLPIPNIYNYHSRLALVPAPATVIGARIQ